MKLWPFTGSATVATRSYGNEYDYFKGRTPSLRRPSSTSARSPLRAHAQPVRSDESSAAPSTASTTNTGTTNTLTTGTMAPAGGVGNDQQTQAGARMNLPMQSQQLQYQNNTAQPAQRRKVPPTSLQPPPIPSSASKPSSSKRGSSNIGTPVPPEKSGVMATAPAGPHVPPYATGMTSSHGATISAAVPLFTPPPSIHQESQTLAPSSEQDNEARQRLSFIESRIKELSGYSTSVRNKHEKLVEDLDGLIRKMNESQEIGEKGSERVKFDVKGKGKDDVDSGMRTEELVSPIVAKFIQRHKDLHEHLLFLANKANNPEPLIPIRSMPPAASLPGLPDQC